MNDTFAHIREHLERRRSELVGRFHRIQRELARAEGPLSADFSEQAVEVQNDEALNAIGRSASAEIAEIEEALQRLSTGQYGSCKQCGQLIDTQRLVTIPQATICARCV